VTPAQRLDLLRRMKRVGCALYTSELAQGAKVSKAEVVDALSELEGQGLVTPATWKLTDDGREAVA
jgi:Mn-dependent DtxR family transcriptional regulator